VSVLRRAIGALVGAAVLLALAGCGRLGGRIEAEEGGPGPDWDAPLVDGVSLAAVEEAQALVPFPVFLPDELGAPVRLVVTDPASAAPEMRAVAAVYDHATYGRFWVIVRISEMSEEELRSWAGCDPAAGCEGSWTLVPFRGSDEAILIEGPLATSVVWLSGDLRYDVVGPAQTFGGTAALEVAADVAATADEGGAA